MTGHEFFPKAVYKHAIRAQGAKLQGKKEA